MKEQYYNWYSHRIKKEIEVIRYGHWGAPVIVFPTACASPWQFKDYGMPWDCEWFLDNGKFQFFSITGFNLESFYNSRLHPADRIHNHRVYEEVVLKEILPLVWDLSKNDYFCCMGASFGAYHAINFTLKYPETFKLGIGFGGAYDIKPYFNGFYNDDIYFCNPVDYAKNMNDWNKLQRFGNSTNIVLMGGAWDQFLYETHDMHHALNCSGIPHTMEVWDPPCDHNEYWWKKQLPHVLNWFF